jgi:hypothetical protein
MSKGCKQQRVSVRSLELAVEALGGFALSTFNGRQCSRCGRPLTDPASRQLGIGPVCNALTTKLAAIAKIAANYPMAVITASFIAEELVVPSSDHQPVHADPSHAKLISAVAVAVSNLVVENAAQAAAADGYKDQAFMEAIGSDNRLIIRAIDTVLSFRGVGRELRVALIRLVKELGYVGVAGVMAGHGSTGPSKLTFNVVSGTMTLTGSKNKPGIMVLREQVSRGKLVTYPCFSYVANAADAIKLMDIALEYWPMLDESVDVVALTQQVKDWIIAHPPMAAPVYAKAASAPQTTPGSPYVSVRVIDGMSIGVTIQNFDWKGYRCTGVVNRIKADINPKRRKYDGMTREWKISDTPFEEAVQTVTEFAKQFDLEVVTVS